MSEPRRRFTSLVELRDALRAFAAERDWDQFHAPKNLVMALAVETAELMEHFQWLTSAESDALGSEDLAAVGAELADVLNYLARLADRLGIDLLEAAAAKIEVNARKYPADAVRGSRRKRRDAGPPASGSRA